MFKPTDKRTPGAFVLASELSDIIDAWPNVSVMVQRWRMRKRPAAVRIVAADSPILFDCFRRSGKRAEAAYGRTISRRDARIKNII
ncbi:hypothetical protein [Roseovarius sp.]|uniref:hypothetical protein n=1 Tax=Roseovarius sp. TaxID=1486281 RepID=UPI003567A62D